MFAPPLKSHIILTEGWCCAAEGMGEQSKMRYMESAACVALDAVKLITPATGQALLAADGESPAGQPVLGRYGEDDAE